MKFAIGRASDSDNLRGKPCENAVLHTTDETWLGGADVVFYTIELNSLDDLYNLMKEVEDPVIISLHPHDDIPSAIKDIDLPTIQGGITIYNDYIE